MVKPRLNQTSSAIFPLMLQFGVFSVALSSSDTKRHAHELFSLDNANWALDYKTTVWETVGFPLDPKKLKRCAEGPTGSLQRPCKAHCKAPSKAPQKARYKAPCKAAYKIPCRLRMKLLLRLLNFNYGQLYPAPTH